MFLSGIIKAIKIYLNKNFITLMTLLHFQQPKNEKHEIFIINQKSQEEGNEDKSAKLDIPDDISGGVAVPCMDDQRTTHADKRKALRYICDRYIFIIVIWYFISSFCTNKISAEIACALDRGFIIGMASGLLLNECLLISISKLNSIYSMLVSFLLYSFLIALYILVLCPILAIFSTPYVAIFRLY